jgi:hypothetical protein
MATRPHTRLEPRHQIRRLNVAGLWRPTPYERIRCERPIFRPDQWQREIDCNTPRGRNTRPKNYERMSYERRGRWWASPSYHPPNKSTILGLVITRMFVPCFHPPPCPQIDRHGFSTQPRSHGPDYFIISPIQAEIKILHTDLRVKKLQSNTSVPVVAVGG